MLDFYTATKKIVDFLFLFKTTGHCAERFRSHVACMYHGFCLYFVSRGRIPNTILRHNFESVNVAPGRVSGFEHIPGASYIHSAVAYVVRSRREDRSLYASLYVKMLENNSEFLSSF